MPQIKIKKSRKARKRGDKSVHKRDFNKKNAELILFLCYSNYYHYLCTKNFIVCF